LIGVQIGLAVVITGMENDGERVLNIVVRRETLATTERLPSVTIRG